MTRQVVAATLVLESRNTWTVMLLVGDLDQPVHRYDATATFVPSPDAEPDGSIGQLVVTAQTTQEDQELVARFVGKAIAAAVGTVQDHP